MSRYSKTNSLLAVIILLLILIRNHPITCAPTAPQVIQWKNCTQNVPETLAASLGFPAGTTDWPSNATGLGLPAKLPTNLNCGKLHVPLDYNRPFGKDNNLTISFSITKAVGRSKGLVLFNPGGPGVDTEMVGWASALNLPFPPYGPLQDYLSKLANYDILFYGPRGNGASGTVICNETLLKPLNNATTFLGTPSDFSHLKSTLTAYGNSCEDLTAPNGLLKFIGVEDAAKDWESLRIALGAKKAHWLGTSYGSLYGAVWASKYPERADKVVLDAVVPTGMDRVEVLRNGVRAINRLVLRTDAWCLKNDTCPFHPQGKGSIPKALELILSSVPSKLANQLRIEISTLLSSQSQFFNTTLRLSQYYQAVKSQDYRNVTEPLEGTRGFYDQSSSAGVHFGTFNALWCSDQAGDELTYDFFNKTLQNLKKIDPYGFTEVSFEWQSMLGCLGWPVKKSNTLPLFKLNQEVMWVTSLYDLNTPTELSTFAYTHTPNSILLIRNGDDHTTLLQNNQPAGEVELAYLVNGTVKVPAAPGSNPTTTTTTTTKELNCYSIVRSPSKRPEIDDPYKVPVGTKAGDVKN